MYERQVGSNFSTLLDIYTCFLQVRSLGADIVIDYEKKTNLFDALANNSIDIVYGNLLFLHEHTFTNIRLCEFLRTVSLENVS